jgi:hypothetical protein
LIQRENKGPYLGNNFRIPSGCKGVDSEFWSKLVKEINKYQEVCKKFESILAKIELCNRPAVLWKWWWSLNANTDIKTFCSLARKAVLVQPTSTLIERCFSVVKGHTSDRQAGEEDDTLECRALCLSCV